MFVVVSVKRVRRARRACAWMHAGAVVSIGRQTSVVVETESLDRWASAVLAVLMRLFDAPFCFVFTVFNLSWSMAFVPPVYVVPTYFYFQCPVSYCFTL